MKTFLLLLWLLPTTACLAAREAEAVKPKVFPPGPAAVTYTVSQQITLVNEGPQFPEKHHIWVALIADQAPYQKVLSRDIQPASYVLTGDEYGNEYAEFDLRDIAPGQQVQIAIRYEVAVHALAFELQKCAGDLPQTDLHPELHIESNNPQIISLADSLADPDQTVCEQVRRFYDFIGDNLVYSYNGDDWGAQAALGEMGADCTEYSSLLIALSRAQGIPARYVEGLLYQRAGSAPEARQEHAWVEVFFPGTGWVPIDPTLGRSSLTRDLHFARYSAEHIIVTNGRHPSTLRGASYWSHLYWPGDSTTIRIQDAGWQITPQNNS